MQYSELLDPTIGPYVLSLLEHNMNVPPEDMGAVLSKTKLGGKVMVWNQAIIQHDKGYNDYSATRSARPQSLRGEIFTCDIAALIPSETKLDEFVY
eukprot:491726-Rhodomonas_salina.1